MDLILGSSSKYRKEILENHGYVFEVITPDIDEKGIRTSDPYDLPLTLAREKAHAVIKKLTQPSLVITCDTVVVCDGELYEKPNSEEELRMFLSKYWSGYPAIVVGAIVVTDSDTGKQVHAVDVCKVFFKSMDEEALQKYIALGNPYERAGGFAIQHPTFTPYIEKFEGDKEAIIGINVSTLKELLQKVATL
jgi:septum formation protein